MVDAPRPHVLFVGRRSLWRERAEAHLCARGISVEARDKIDDAVAAVKSDPTITCVVLVEEMPREPWIAGLARMAIARPDLRVIVLGTEYDLDAMVQYIRLGRRDEGPPLVQYHLKDYDYDKLGSQICGDRCATASAR
jgi:DNA-binding NtrC family response regulator